MAFLSMQGGFDAYKASGGTFDYLLKIYEADPADDLSGLRIIADHMYLGRPVDSPTDEPMLDPETARTWLLDSGQAVETESGLELLSQAQPDHIAIAGLAIALGKEPRYLSEAYATLPDHPVQLAELIVSEKAKIILETYQKQTDS